MKLLIALGLLSLLASPAFGSLADDLMEAGDWSVETGLETDDVDDSDYDWDDVEVDGK